MATIDWPAGLIPQAAQLSLRKIGAQFTSPLNGTLQAVDFIGERWTLSASLAAQQRLDPNGVQVFCNQLAGGVERVRVWPFHTGGVPRGTLRGAPTVGALAARGNTSLVLSGCTGVNLMFGGSFEFDTNADGLADGWSAVQIGAITAAAYSRQSAAAEDGIWEQGYEANYGATGLANRVGVERTVQLPAGAGSYTLLANVRGDSELRAVIVCEWRTALGAIISESTAVDIGVTPAVQRIGGSVVAPAGTAQVTIRLLTYRSVGTGARAARWDVCAIKAGSVDLTWPGGATLLPGDFGACGGQLFQVAARAVASDAGVMTVPIVNRVRAAIAVASPFTWYRPTCEMVLPAMQAGPVHRPGFIESTALDLVEVW